MTRERMALDTNVLSEIMNPRPAAQVVRFVAGLEEPFVSAAVFHEMAYGASRLPEGKRKTRFFAEIEAFHQHYEDRIIFIGYEVARKFGELRAQAQSLGFDLKPLDSLIAASALVAGARLATRNLKDSSHLESIS